MSKALTAPPAVPPTSLDVLAETLVHGGAILTIPGAPPRHHLVGHLAWLDPRRLFWFTAHGDTPDDGQVLDFDDARAVSDKWIHFYRAGALAATLSGIRTAGVDDPDDYVIAWQLWHEVAPRRARLIANSLARLAGADASDALPPVRRPAERPPSTPVRPG